jgi:hypothetical protein
VLTFGVLSFGNQGAAQAQNLRDSGIPNESILIANRADSYAEDAKSKGFIVEHDLAKAAGVADSECNEYHHYTARTNSSYRASTLLAHPRSGSTWSVQ